jgi:hypothetical protein
MSRYGARVLLDLLLAESDLSLQLELEGAAGADAVADATEQHGADPRIQQTRRIAAEDIARDAASDQTECLHARDC